jgi:bacitracin transport system permease protein
LLRLIQAEFLKLRRKKFIVLMLLSALFMPLLAVFYFRSADKTVIEPLQFYKWTTFSYTAWIILPVVLGLVSTMLMYDENQNDMLKQLWIIPISKTGYFFSKFIVVLSYSVCLMCTKLSMSVARFIVQYRIAILLKRTLLIKLPAIRFHILTSFLVESWWCFPLFAG